ncbi:MAG TPA: alpha/beta fold hydrolase [Pseudomonas xinjiangensis]|uniref:Alpha/beta fold hydrolase n=2 Tax=root TaxID=1 RepID=A0A7V1FS41_9GAMM|nr:alpha/beta fold hydrolase [Halopseudomonas xinjiangensis]HEC48655.1 alpha/beta fold hydrolase [Halopseudomonas xinjiangensis]
MSRNAEERLLIEGPAGPLELVVTRGDDPTAVAVICHPHPLHGGTLHNKVVHTLMRAARDQGASTVRFNFRGVGKSGGEHAAGQGEIDDCLAVIDWAHGHLGAEPLWLMGFSFGGYVAAAAACRLETWPRQLVLVGPSVERLPFGDLMPLPGPASVMMGEADEVVASAAVFALLEGKPGIKMVRFPDTGHFFHGRLVELKEAVEAQLD